MTEEIKIKKTPKKRVAKKKISSQIEIPENKIQALKNKVATPHEYVGISRSVGMTSIIMTLLVLLISPSSVWILGPIIGAMAIFGIAMGYFASK
ncbi:MAG: hypothetical protein IT284_01240 [Bacteroidetes bacterium]|nr:hypothetical protein [Bacteroidota bacterium]